MRQLIGTLRVRGRLAQIIFSVLAVCLTNPVFAATRGDVSRYYGVYKIYDVKKIGGGLTSDAAAAQWIGSSVEIRPLFFSIRDVRINHPRYLLEEIDLPDAEGEVISNEYSIFWGIGEDRKKIKRILVFESQKEKYPYQKIEILDNNVLLVMFDERVYFFKPSGQIP